MYGKYIFLAFVIIMAVASPVAGSLTKISAGAPVYLGEQNLDISSALQGCRIIDWWAHGTDLTAPPAKNITIIKSVEDSDIAFRYSINPEIFSGYTGTWYCEDKKPLRAVFEVVRPHLSISFWDLDNNEDITGKTVPLTANITYHIDTNLDRALQYRHRPGITPQDSFFTVTLTDSRGNALHSLYSGSYGKADTHIITFENRPFISVSPYFWKEGGTWDLESRNAQGESLYPAGTYSLIVKQNLNHMEEMYADSSPENRSGLIEASATVTFIKPEPTYPPVVSIPVPSKTVQVTATTPVTELPSAEPTLSSVPTKTTYSPIPPWTALAALGIAGIFLVRKRV